MNISQRYIIVLANLMDFSGRLNAESAQRADLAISLEKIKPARHIILCGWAYRFDSDIPIAQALKSYISEKCPNMLHKLVCQSMSRDTVGDAFFSRLLIEKICECSSGFEVEVVTSDYHVGRTLEIFRFIFWECALVAVKGSATKTLDPSHNLREQQSLGSFRKTFENVVPGDLPGIHRAISCYHPFYNGDIHPKIDSLESIYMSLGPRS